MIVGMGVDIVEVARMRKAIENSGMEEKVFTDNEIGYCADRKSRDQNYAGRFAAKEAALKALGTGWAEGIRWKDVETVPDERGRPHLVLRGRALEVFEESGANRSHVTITHSDDYAVAVVVLETAEEGTGVGS